MALGKGLGALIAPTGKKEAPVRKEIKKETKPLDEEMWFVPMSEIEPDQKQPRKHFDEEALKELAESIKIHGILQPLLLSEKKDGGYEIIAGERRYRAAEIAGLFKVPAVVKHFKDEEKLEVALIENIQREQLNPIEEAFAFKRLIDEFGLTQEKVAEKVGKSRPAVANTVRLLDLPDQAQRALINKKINSGQARALLGLKSEADRLEMLSSMLGQKITVREMENKVSQKKNGESGKDANLAYFENQMREALGTKVKIIKKGEKGKIMIDFYSSDEFKDLLDRILNS